MILASLRCRITNSQFLILLSPPYTTGYLLSRPCQQLQGLQLPMGKHRTVHKEQQQSDDGNGQHIIEQQVVFCKDVFLGIDHPHAPSQPFHHPTRYLCTLEWFIEHVTVAAIQREILISRLASHHGLSGSSHRGVRSVLRLREHRLVQQLVRIRMHQVRTITS